MLVSVRMDVKCSWEPVGAVRQAADGLVMPLLAAEPAVYQLVFQHDGRERRYVGETANMRRRLADYRRPGTRSSTNRRMNERARRVLAAGGKVLVLVAVDVQLARSGQPLPVNLGSKHVRCLIENAALVEVLATVGELVNDRGYGDLNDDPVLC